MKNTSLRITLFGQVGNWRIDAKTVVDLMWSLIGGLVGSLAMPNHHILALMINGVGVGVG
ncbi:hypothetical protein P8610_09980 [Fictibacillus sp. UD]|uniref:hypothetical protein n=1 Tax=Fictibacillus sp. UD TaxID=3038777 RepID=UPI003746C614